MTSSASRNSDASGVVLVHGWSCGWEDWKGVAALLPATINPVMARLPGSLDGPPLIGQASLPAAAEEVLSQALQRGCETFALVGHSMGARIALELAARYPERVTSLLLVDGSNVLDEPDDATDVLTRRLERLGRQEWAAQMIGSMMVEGLPAAEQIYLIQRTAAHDERVLKEYYRAMMEWDRDQFFPSLMRVSCPVTVLQATSVDENRVRHLVSEHPSSRWVDSIREHVPAADIRLVPDTGHFLMLERPAPVAKWIEAAVTT